MGAFNNRRYWYDTQKSSPVPQCLLCLPRVCSNYGNVKDVDLDIMRTADPRRRGARQIHSHAVNLILPITRAVRTLEPSRKRERIRNILEAEANSSLALGLAPRQCQHLTPTLCKTVVLIISTSIIGLVVEFVVAIDEARVRFTDDALIFLFFCS